MKEVALKDICNKDSSALKQKELLPKGKYPVYGASGIAGYLDSYHQEDAYIGIVKDGSGIGRVAFYPEKTSLIGTMQYILPKRGYNIRYIGYCLQSLDLSKYKQGAAIPHIYFRDYGKRLVKVTDNEDEQRSIVSRFDAAFAGIDALKANAEKQLAEARQLFQAELAECMRPKEGWEEKTIEDLSVKLFAGGDVPKESFSKEQTSKYNIPIVSNGIEQDGLYGYTEFAKVNDPAVTISGRGTIGYVVERLEPFFPIIRLITIVPKLDIIGTRFLCYALRNIDFTHSGSSIPQLTVPMVKGIKIGVPSKSDQHSIVTRLDALSANVRKLEEVQRKTLAECDALKQAMLKEVFE